ncbi:hypothetical protein [Streptomyces sp. NRRL F-5630]
MSDRSSASISGEIPVHVQAARPGEQPCRRSTSCTEFAGAFSSATACRV